MVVFFVPQAFRSDVHLAPDDRFETILFGPRIKLHRPEQIAMVSHGDSGHAELLGALEQGLVPDGRIKQAVVSVDVEMDEVGMAHQITLDPAGC